jgi:YVTN family beta-propeller protein
MQTLPFSPRTPRTLASACLLGAGIALGACGGDGSAASTTSGDASSGSTGSAGSKTLAETLYVAHEGRLTSYAVATGEERPGEVQNVARPTDLQALADGTLLVNLTDSAAILIVDGATMLERARVPSSAGAGLRPVHSYLSPEHVGKRYWLSLNDGKDGKLETNSARFVDVTPGSATYLMPAGEVALGVGHHKATFSATRERVVISNIGDCDNVLSVYDYTNVADIKKLATLSAAAAGFDGSTRDKTCDPTFAMGAPPAPHGCATSIVSGKAYCNLTTSGGIVVIDLDADKPTFTVLPTHGAGAGYTKALPDGRYVYSLQDEPREGSTKRPGAKCQVGQIVVIDAMTSAVAKEVPLFYKGPGCADALAGTDEATAEPGHILASPDGKKLFVGLAGAYGDAKARVRQELVLDLKDPASPAQLASIPVGASTGHHDDKMSGDGKRVFVANNVDGTVTQIDAVTHEVKATIKVKDNPRTLATFGSVEGPSTQTGPLR